MRQLSHGIGEVRIATEVKVQQADIRRVQERAVTTGQLRETEELIGQYADRIREIDEAVAVAVARYETLAGATLDLAAGLGLDVPFAVDTLDTDRMNTVINFVCVAAAIPKPSCHRVN